MDIQTVRAICLALPAVTESIKWDNDLVFSVGEKMFCILALDPPFKCSFKVPDEDFEALSTTAGFIPAPYMARAKWVSVQEATLTKKQWEAYIAGSHALVVQKLTKKRRTELGLV